MDKLRTLSFVLILSAAGVFALLHDEPVEIFTLFCALMIGIRIILDKAIFYIVKIERD